MHATPKVWDGDRIYDDHDDGDDVYARDLAMAHELGAYGKDPDDYMIAPIGEKHISDSEDASGVGAVLLGAWEDIDMELEGTTNPYDGWAYKRDMIMATKLDDYEKRRSYTTALAHEGLHRRA